MQLTIAAAQLLLLGPLALAYPQQISKGKSDFSLDASYTLSAKDQLARRDGYVIGQSGPTASFTVGGQKLVGLLDAGASLLTTRNISQISGPNDQNGYYAITQSPTVTTMSGASWQECFNTGCDGGPVVKDNVVLGQVEATQALIFACDDSCQGSGSNFGERALSYRICLMRFTDISDHQVWARGLTTQYSYNGGVATGPSFFGSLAPNLSLALWTLSLDNSRAAFDFGYINASSYSGSIGYLDIDYTGNWQSNVTGYSFSNGGGSNTSTLLRFALDTGDSEMGLPPVVVADFFKGVSGATESGGNWQFPCDATLPDFTINVGGVDVTVEGSNFNGGEVSSGVCGSLLVPGTSSEVNTWGLPFLQGVFTVFSYEYGSTQEQIGFANKPT